MNDNLSIEKLVESYMKLCIKGLIPHEIIKQIEFFYNINNIIPFNVINNEFKPETVNVNNIINFHINSQSLFYISSNYNVYVSGNNTFGQLGLSHFRDTFMKKHKYFNKKSIYKAEFFSHGLYNCHCFAYTKDNKLYGFGNNEYKQLGFKSQNKVISKPKLINYSFNSSLIQIECGYYHTLFLTLNGNIYGCGNNDLGQLSNNYIQSNTKYSINLIKHSHKIVQIGCGNTSSFILCTNNIIYSTGTNFHGELGIGKIDDELCKIYRIKFIPIKIGGDIKLFNVGVNHIGSLTNKNEVYMWGNNKYFQCGFIINKVKSKLYLPKKIDLFDELNVINIKCGVDHTILKTKDGKYYGFGNNDRGQLFIDNSKINKRISPVSLSNKFIQNKTHCKGDILDIIPGYKVTYILQKISSQLRAF